MDANEALDGLLHVSAQVREAVLLDSDGIVARGALSAERASRLAAGGQTLLERAGALRGEPPVDREALVDVLMGLSEAAAADGSIVSADLNPPWGRPAPAAPGPEAQVRPAAASGGIDSWLIDRLFGRR